MTADLFLEIKYKVIYKVIEAAIRYINYIQKGYSHDFTAVKICDNSCRKRDHK
ncbi:hypothetical protein acsn021_31060 [Anaerocolumna cellulosilytica]|uniref:Uncharacterized protein n=1 Tax=Anaerocolumna cellulosilytica TaxID=433286 RepID=A0A6S6R618_9FIRM|nr:hypothetical protein acsn021_31060 [Anaerocolumna cellulosilytica]